MLPEGFLNAPGAWGSDALVDRERLPQVGGAFAGVAVLEVAVADSFQGACFLQGPPMSRAMASAWVWWSRAWPVAEVRERELAEAVQRLGLAERLPRSRNSRQGVLVAGGGGRVVPGLLLHEAEVVQRFGLAVQVAEVRNNARACWWLAAAAG